MNVVFVLEPFEEAGAAELAIRFILAAFVSGCAAPEEKRHLFFNAARRIGRNANLKFITTLGIVSAENDGTLVAS